MECPRERKIRRSQTLCTENERRRSNAEHGKGQDRGNPLSPAGGVAFPGWQQKSRGIDRGAGEQYAQEVEAALAGLQKRAGQRRPSRKRMEAPCASPWTAATNAFKGAFLPAGLLPLADIEAFQLAGDSKFTATLAGPKTLALSSCRLHYATTVTGELCTGMVVNVRGIQVEDTILSFQVKVPVRSLRFFGPATGYVDVCTGLLSRGHRIPQEALQSLRYESVEN